MVCAVLNFYFSGKVSLFYYTLQKFSPNGLGISPQFKNQGFPGGSVGKEPTCNAGDHLKGRRPRFNPWVGKVPWRRKWQPTPVFLSGKSHGQRSRWATAHGVSKNQT